MRSSRTWPPLVPSLTERDEVCRGRRGDGRGTVTANAPNPAGQAILSRFFDGSVLPIGLLGALLPTAVATLALRLLAP